VRQIAQKKYVKKQHALFALEKKERELLPTICLDLTRNAEKLLSKTPSILLAKSHHSSSRVLKN
jgi:hypothetical protein